MPKPMTLSQVRKQLQQQWPVKPRHTPAAIVCTASNTNALVVSARQANRSERCAHLSIQKPAPSAPSRTPPTASSRKRWSAIHMRWPVRCPAAG
jgi:hypothetical protein